MPRSEKITTARTRREVTRSAPHIIGRLGTSSYLVGLLVGYSESRLVTYEQFRINYIILQYNDCDWLPHTSIDMFNDTHILKLHEIILS